MAATQFENLGDIVLAKEVVRRARDAGELFVDDSGCPADYCALLGLRAEESSLRSGSFKRRLLGAAFGARRAGAGRVFYVLKPGHLKNDHRGVKQYLHVAWLALLNRLGVKIVRYGTSIELPDAKAVAFERARARCYADYTLRDHVSIALAQKAGVPNVRYYPDLALGLPFSGGGTRDCLCASFRSDLAADADQGESEMFDRTCAMLEQVSKVCPDLTLLMVSQVYRDDDFNRAIAKRFGADLVLFDGGEASKGRLFETYARSRLTLSNRLHVLLFAASRGAVPVPVVDPDLNAKVVNVLSALGLGELVHDARAGADIEPHLRLVLDRESGILAAVERAFEEAAALPFLPPNATAGPR